MDSHFGELAVYCPARNPMNNNIDVFRVHDQRCAGRVEGVVERALGDSPATISLKDLGQPPVGRSGFRLS